MRKTSMLAALALASVSAQAAVDVTVNVNLDRRLVHPEIYGMNFSSAAQLNALKVPLNRSGGNSTSRYNWQGQEHNSANDWFYIDYGPSQTDSVDTFVTQARAAGATPLITIPTIGWAPINSGETRHWGFSVAKYGAQINTEFTTSGGQNWANADAGDGTCNAANTKINPNNGQPYCQGGKIVGNDPADTSIVVNAAFEGQWVTHLQQTFGSGADGVHLYALDNEPMLWNSTHRDVHPLPAGFDDAWQWTLDYGTAIKNADPAAKVTGPVTWGYCDLFGSAKDNCAIGSDRSGHSPDNQPFVAWYLKQVCAHPMVDGRRLVDFLDLHYYPQGGQSQSNDESASVASLRLRSVKELYDTSYVSESWIADLGDDATFHYSKPGLLPRVRQWIADNCPGTGIAITEYNWGGADNSWEPTISEEGVSSALAQAEVMAIFGREGVSMATRWVAPKVGTAVETAFKLFLDYDGAHSRVVGHSVRATSTAVDLVASYAVDLYGQRTMVLLFNKSTSAQTANLHFVQHYTGAWNYYRFTGAPGGYGVGAIVPTAGGTLSAANALPAMSLPARSATLVVLPAPGDSDVIFYDGFGQN